MCFAQVSAFVSPKLNHLVWASMKQWLHPNISPRRALLAWARRRSPKHTHNSSPGWGYQDKRNKILRNLAWASHSRLGENICRSKPQTSRLYEKSCSTLTGLIATSLSRANLAWASERVAQPKNLSPARDTWTKTLNKLLQLSLRREELTWARIAKFRICSRTPLAKTKTKTPLNHYQHNTMASNPQNHIWYSFGLQKLEILINNNTSIPKPST